MGRLSGQKVKEEVNAFSLIAGRTEGTSAKPRRFSLFFPANFRDIYVPNATRCLVLGENELN